MVEKNFYKLVLFMVAIVAISQLWRNFNSESILRVVGLLFGAAIIFIPIFIRMIKRKK